MQGHNCWVKWLVLFLLFLGKLLTVFHRSCTDLHYHQQPTKIPLTSYSLQDLIFCVLLLINFLICVSWYLSVVLICISLMICNVEHLFMCLLAINNFSFEKCVFSSSSHFSIELLVFWCWVVWTLYIYFGYQLLIISTYFLLFSMLSFHFSKVSFAV